MGDGVSSEVEKGVEGVGYRICRSSLLEERGRGACRTLGGFWGLCTCPCLPFGQLSREGK